MWYEELFAEMVAAADPQQAEKMAAYMQKLFPFLGISKSQLKEIMKPYLAEMKAEKLDWECVYKCWEKDFREAQYVGVEYLVMHKKELVPADIDKFKKLITEKSWWEVADRLAGLVGVIAKDSPKVKQELLRWSEARNMWLRRVAIDFQQKYKQETDTELLTAIISNNFGSKEFFINKAIGWSLREYAKTNPAWVRDFIETNKRSLTTFSIKEATKKQ